MTPKKLVGQKSEPDVVTLLTDQNNFADFAQFSQDISSAEGVPGGDFPQFKAGAFEVYRRPDLNHSGKTTASATTSLPAGVTLKHAGDVVNSKEENIAVERLKDGVPEEKRIQVSKSPSKIEKHGLRSAVRTQREQNTMLSRLNGELNQELSEVMEERIALEIQLEHLKPFST